MKTILTIALSTVLILVSLESQAFKHPTHKRIVEDAVAYMAAHPDTTNFVKLSTSVETSGYSIEQFANALGQGARDVDDFEDTYLCGSVSGYCELSPVFGLGKTLTGYNYSSFWHFQNHSRGNDVHGNDLGGYNYSQIPNKGTTDYILGFWLAGDHLDDGKGGMTGWCFWGWCLEHTEYDSYAITAEKYSIGSRNKKSHYDNFNDTAFQPIDNLGQYWYNEFIKSPTVQTLGFSLHATDLLQPHHTWTSSGNYHVAWEAWVEDHYDVKGMNNHEAVTEAMNSFTPIALGQNDIRPLLTEGGAISYSQGGIVLTSTSDEDRSEVAAIVIPHAIAMVVHILNHAAERF